MHISCEPGPLSGKVDCSSDNMTIVIQRAYLNSLGYDGESLYLNDPYCRPQVSRYQVVFNFLLNACGTVQKVDDSSPSGKHLRHSVLSDTHVCDAR